MSDHIDGPRQIGDPSADVTDLFAFTSPETPSRTVLAMNVFPTCGQNANFSNAVTHSIVVRRARVTGLGDAAGFATADPEIRFGFRFDPLTRRLPGERPGQSGACILPDGRTLRLTVDDAAGASTSDGLFRVFAGLRSDPFVLAWLFNRDGMTKFQNLLHNDNVLSIVIEFETERVLDLAAGSLFGVIAETTPLAHRAEFVGTEPARIDWIGRPEQTNMILNNPAFAGERDDLRDLWNQQTPFAVADDLRPLFLQRLKDSLAQWDMRDGRQDWQAAAIAAHANVRIDDCLLFDVAKPITDASHLEIERSTLAGRAHETGGGRTVDAEAIDILLTLMVSHDREQLQGGATTATKPGTRTFPYLAAPNTEMQSLAQSVGLAAPLDAVWSLVGAFGGDWHPLIASSTVIGSGVGELRVLETIDGKRIIDRLDALDPSARSYRYSGVSGIPASDYVGTLEVKARGAGSLVEWQAHYLADGQGDIIVRTILSTLFKAGLDSLKARFGAAR